MAFLAAAAPYIAAAGTVISTVSQMQAGQADQAAADYQAEQLEDKAKSDLAESQRAAIEARRQGQLAASRARAVAAAGGGSGSTDVVNRIADLEGEGEYNALVQLYQGKTSASGALNQANALRTQGAQSRKAGQIGGLSSMLSGSANLAAKYG